MRLLTALVGAGWLALTLGGDDARAASGSTAFAVAVAVDSRCAIGTTPVAFGNYVSGGLHATTPLDATGTLAITCQAGRVVRILLDQGLYPAAGSSDEDPLRQMGNGADRLPYNLYEDAARSTVWDNTGPGVRPPAPTTYPVNMTVYGRIAAGLLPAPGAYSDTITVTFSW